MHNHLRQGQVAMADVWATTQWPHRHFAEGLGFWEVNVFKALVYFHPDYAKLQHPRFRVLLAHAMLTLGKVQFGTSAAPAPAAQPDSSYCSLERFKRYKNEKHQCGYCKAKSYFYCPKCFPDGTQPNYGICPPTNKNKPCLHKHIAGIAPTHRAQQVAKRTMTRDSPMRPKTKQARTNSGAGSVRRRLDRSTPDDGDEQESETPNPNPNPNPNPAR